MYMDNKISFFRKFLYSFNPKKYIFLIKESLGKSFMYVAIISIILGFIQGVINIKLFDYIEKSVVDILNNDKYRFEIKEGNLQFYNSPYKYDEGQLIVYIDSNKKIGNIRELDNITIHKDNAIILLQDGLCIRNNDYEIEFTYNDLLLNSTLNNKKIVNSIESYNNIKYMIIPIVILFNIIQFIICSLLISLIGVLFNIFSLDNFKYSNIYKLSIYASTLPIIIMMFISIGSISIIIGGVILTLGLTTIKGYEK